MSMQIGHYRRKKLDVTDHGFQVNEEACDTVNNCTYEFLRKYCGVIMSNQGDEEYQKDNFIHNRETASFHIKSQMPGQTPLPWDLQKDDYLIWQEVYKTYDADGILLCDEDGNPIVECVDIAFRITSVIRRRLAAGCCVFTIKGERIEPKECKNIIRGCGELIVNEADY